MSFQCMGHCGLYMDKPDSWCISCLPEQKNDYQIRREIWHWGFQLVYGNKEHQKEALEQINHLVFVLAQIVKY